MPLVVFTTCTGGGCLATQVDRHRERQLADVERSGLEAHRSQARTVASGGKLDESWLAGIGCH